MRSRVDVAPDDAPDCGATRGTTTGADVGTTVRPSGHVTRFSILLARNDLMSWPRLLPTTPVGYAPRSRAAAMRCSWVGVRR